MRAILIQLMALRSQDLVPGFDGFRVSLGFGLDTHLDLCVSSLHRGQANLLCIVPHLPDVELRD